MCECCVCTVCIISAIITSFSSITMGVCCAYYKHLKKRYNKD